MEEKITPPQKPVMVVFEDGSYDINIPKGPFEIMEAFKLIYNALLDYTGLLDERERFTFILSEIFAHEDFSKKIISKLKNEEILHKLPTLH
jgi:hypothetical protein